LDTLSYLEREPSSEVPSMCFDGVDDTLDLPRISGEALAHFTARFSNCTGLW
jgi:hypothetical protein